MLKQSIFDMRAEEASHVDIHNPRYKNLITEQCKIQDQMKKLIPQNLKDQFYDLLIQYESTCFKAEEIETKLAYKQGVYDGLEIATLLLKVNK